MTNNSDGLSPTLRAQLGTAWGRALPAAFGFGNGIQFDGVNDMLIGTPTFSGLTIGNEFAFECWVRSDVVANKNIMYFQNAAGDYISLFNGGNATSCRIWGSASSGIVDVPSPPGKVHFVLNSSSLKAVSSFGIGGDIESAPVLSSLGGIANISYMCIGAGDDVANRIPIGNVIYHYAGFIDELRIYNRLVSKDEARLNYNNGIGENPSITEGLIAWYSFETAESPESLYPSGLPSGWPVGAYGIRDRTDNQRHLYQQNIGDTSNLGGALKPF